MDADNDDIYITAAMLEVLFKTIIHSRLQIPRIGSRSALP